MSVFKIVIPGTTPYGFRLSGGDGEVVYVARVRGESKAEQAGLKENDIVVAINGILCNNLSYNSVFGLTELQENLQIYIMRGDEARFIWRETCEGLTGHLLNLSEHEVISLLQKKSHNNAIFIQNDFSVNPKFQLSTPTPKVRTYSNPSVNLNGPANSTTLFIDPKKRSSSSTLTMTLMNPSNVEPKFGTRYSESDAPATFATHASSDRIKTNVIQVNDAFKETEIRLNWHSNHFGNLSKPEMLLRSYNLNNDAQIDHEEKEQHPDCFKPNTDAFKDTEMRLNFNSDRLGNLSKSEIKFKSYDFTNGVQFNDKKESNYLNSNLHTGGAIKLNFDSKHGNLTNPDFQIKNYNINNGKHFGEKQDFDQKPFPPSNFDLQAYSINNYSDNDQNLGEKMFRFDISQNYHTQTKEGNTRPLTDKQHSNSLPSFVVKPPNILKLYNIGSNNKATTQEEPKRDEAQASDDKFSIRSKQTTLSNYNQNEQYQVMNHQMSHEDQVNEPVPPPAPPIPIGGIPISKTSAPSNVFSILSTVDNLKDEEKNTMKSKFQMAKNIAMSVLAPANKNSKGQKMFLRRKEMSAKWTVQNPEVPNNLEDRQNSVNVQSQFNVNKPWLRDEKVTLKSSQFVNKSEGLLPQKSYAQFSNSFTLPGSHTNVVENSTIASGYRPINFYANTKSLGYCDL